MKPEHVGLIIDGNRRFAKRLMKQPWKGHEYGAEKVEKLFDWAKDLGIKELTIYGFSIQNFNRPKREFDYLMNVFKEFFDKAKTSKTIHDNKIRIKFIGRIHLFPKDVYEKCLELEKVTKDYAGYKVNFALAYGGREEIIDAIKKLGRDVEDGKMKIEDLDENVFEKFLYMKSEPDMIIRTGGDHRTSNFLAWQGIYSEWFFVKKMWPEFEKEDFVKCIEEFSKRERRFGR